MMDVCSTLHVGLCDGDKSKGSIVERRERERETFEDGGDEICDMR